MSYLELKKSHGLDVGAVTMEIKEVSSAGEFAGYASVYDEVDQGRDVVDRKAFDRFFAELKEGGPLPKLLWQHNPGQPIGLWTSVKSDERGLWAEGKLLTELPRGKEAHILMENKAIDGLSIGYRTRDYKMEAGRVRRLLDVDLKEISFVTFPMNVSSTVLDVKELKSIRDVEHILRDAGVPANFAKAVAVKGYDAALAEVEGNQRDAEAKQTEARKRLLAGIKTLKENLNG